MVGIFAKQMFLIGMEIIDTKQKEVRLEWKKVRFKKRE